MSSKAPPYPIDLEALDDRLAFLGMPGSGKTYNATGAIEHLMASGARVGLVDALGVMWGLRVTADGKGPSNFPIVIFGGGHADIPITEAAGGLIGETVASIQESFILDLSELSDAAQRRFMLNFLSALYKHQPPEPLHLVFDEADMWAPQQILDKEGGASQLLGKMQTIVRRGRVHGFIPWLLTQRPAVLNNSVLGMADGLVIFRIALPHDREAVGRWLEANATRDQAREILDQLATLQVGQAVVWNPRRGPARICLFPEKQTYDSSRTPKRGEQRSAVDLKPLDVPGLKARLAGLEAELHDNDPKALKARIKQLEGQLAAKAPTVPLRDPGADAAIHSKGYGEGRAEGNREVLLEYGARLEGLSDLLRLEAGKILARAAGGSAAGQGDAQAAVPSAPPRGDKADAAADQLTAPAGAKNSRADLQHGFSAPARPTPGASLGAKAKVLQALAWWKAAGFPTIDRRRVCILAGYSPTASTFGVYIGQLKEAGLVTTPAAGEISLTPAGEAAAPPIDAAASLIDAARALFSPAELKVFNAILAAWPRAIARSDLADQLGLSRTASTLGVYIGRITSFGFVETPRGEVRAVDWLFSGARG